MKLESWGFHVAVGVCAQQCVCACLRVLRRAEGIFKQMCRLFILCFNKTHPRLLICLCFTLLICLQAQLILFCSISLSHSTDSISTTRQYKNASLKHTGAFGICGWCRKLLPSELWWLRPMFSVLNQFPIHTPAKVTTVVSCRSDRVVQTMERRDKTTHPRCVSPHPAAHWFLLSYSYVNTHTNIWAQRAIISPAVYFRRPCSPRKNTHCNLAVHKCRVAGAGRTQGIWVHWETAIQTDTHTWLSAYILFSVCIISTSSSFSVRLCSSKLAPCLSSKLPHKGKNNSACQNSCKSWLQRWKCVSSAQDSEQP